VTAFYDEQKLNGLLKILVELPDVAIENLINELAYMADNCSSEQSQKLRERAAEIYNVLEDMSETAEKRESLR